jgi:phage repressor protein C with HTH and peptisase S24 domain
MTINETDVFIYRPSITLRNGKKLIAAHYGKKAWKIPIKKQKPNGYPANDNTPEG